MNAIRPMSPASNAYYHTTLGLKRVRWMLLLLLFPLLLSQLLLLLELCHMCCRLARKNLLTSNACSPR